MKKLTFIAIVALAGLTFACQTETPSTNTPAANKPAANNSINGNTTPATSPGANANTPNTNGNMNGNANGNVSTSANPTAGEAVQLADAGVSMNLPAGLKTKKEGSDTIVTTADGATLVHFTTLADTYEKASAAASTEVAKFVKDAKPVKQGEKSTVGGMDAVSTAGTGTGKDGKPVNYNATVINAPKKPLMMVASADQATMQKHAADLDALIKSIKKM